MATREREETQRTAKGQVQCRAEPSAPEGRRHVAGHAEVRHDGAGRRARQAPHCERSCAQLPRRALEGSELDPWEALISEQSLQALWLRSRLSRPWCWTLQENQR